MSLIFIFMFMIFMHIIGDFTLQGILSCMKQKTWWDYDKHKSDFLEMTESDYNKLYAFDYVDALIIHGLMWSLCIMIPIAIWYNFQFDIVCFGIWLFNAVIHMYIDYFKANIHKINLHTDQILHFIQIGITFIIAILYKGFIMT